MFNAALLEPEKDTGFDPSLLEPEASKGFDPSLLEPESKPLPLFGTPLGGDLSKFTAEGKKAALLSEQEQVRSKGRRNELLSKGIDAAIYVVEPFTAQGMLNQPSRLVGQPDAFESNKPIIDLPQVDENDPRWIAFLTGVLRRVPTKTESSALAGAEHLAAQTISGLTTPEGVVTLPAAAASKLVLASFAGHMAYDLPEQVKQGSEVLGDIESTPAEKVVAGGTPVVSSAMIGTMAKHANQLKTPLTFKDPEIKPLVEQVAANPDAKLTAVALKESLETKPLATVGDAVGEQLDALFSSKGEVVKESLTTELPVAPAIRTKSGEIIVAEGKETHDQIIKRQSMDWQLEHRPTLDTEKDFGFVDKDNNFISRRQGADALGEKLDLTSQRFWDIKEKQAETPTVNESLKVETPVAQEAVVAKPAPTQPVPESTRQENLRKQALAEVERQRDVAAKVQTPGAKAKEFNKLLEEHGAELGLITNPGGYFGATGEKTHKGTVGIKNDVAVGKYRAKVRQAIIKELGGEGKWDSQTLSELLPKLKKLIAKKQAVPKLRAGENQGDVFANQTEDFSLTSGKGTDFDRIQKAKEQAERDRAEEDKFQGDLLEGKALSEFSKGPGASNPSDVGAAGAAEQSGVRLAEFINEGSKPDIAVKPDIAEADLKSVDPAVESRWQSAKLERVGILAKGRLALIAAKNSLTRHFPLLDPKTDGAVSNILRVHEGDPNTSKYQASQVIRGITAQLAPKKYDVFSRIVILRDLVNYSENFLAQAERLPFGYKSIDAIKTDLARFEALAQKYPDIKEATNRREEFMDALRYDLVARKLLPEQVKDFGAYFHHQVLEHMAMKNTLASSAADVRVKTKGWQKKRVGSEKDFNTSYLESEFEVISQSFAQIAAQDTLARLKDVADISSELKSAAKETGGDWQSLLPKDYSLWQPEKGNHFYWANSLTERTLDAFFKGERTLSAADIKEVLAMGSKREQWAIPTRLANTLDEFGRQKDHAVEKFIGAGIAQWKRWTLFNPMRNTIYQLNNLSGDFDIAFAVDPKIMKFSAESANTLRKFILQKKAGDAEMNTLIKQGVIDSGFSVQELPDLKGQQFFAALEGNNPGLIQKYWNTVLDYNRWREGILRLSAFKRAMEKLDAGEKFYWTSKKSEIDGMRKDPNITKEELAAKLSREAIGDYGNISHSGQWIRSKMIPFYSWMEINAPRYVRLFQNVKNEGGSIKEQSRIAAVVGKSTVTKTAVLTAKAATFYALVNLWNNMLFPDEFDDLGDNRKQLHLILGRREDGSIMTMRMQGAFSDALDWFGAGNAVEDVKQIQSGRASLGDTAKEMVKAAPNRIINAALPMQKTATEAALGRSFYPDAFNPRVIRDRTGHVAKLFSVGTIYNYLTNKPQRPGTWNPLSLVTYTTDPGEAAYYAAKSITSEWIEKNGMERPVALPTIRGNALYYHKQAIKYKDEKLAEYWLEKYESLGGKDKGIKQSISRSNPRAGITKKDNAGFEESLSPEEKEIMEKADEWFKRTYE